MKTKIKIDGVIAQHTCRFLNGTYDFFGCLKRSDFNADGFGGNDGKLLYIADHEIEMEVDLPDAEQAQARELNAKEKALREKFSEDLMNIETERSKLMVSTLKRSWND